MTPDPDPPPSRPSQAPPMRLGRTLSTPEYGPTPPTSRTRVKVFGSVRTGYTWRVYRRRFRVLWYIANWGETLTLSEALNRCILELRVENGVR